MKIFDEIDKLESKFDKKCEDLGSWFWRKRYHLDRNDKNRKMTLSEVFYIAETYKFEYSKYLNMLKSDINSVPEELHFIFNLPIKDAFRFIWLLQSIEFGFFYYPGMDPLDTFYDKRYYNLKKEFLAKKYKVDYVAPVERVSYVLVSVFPSKEIQDICYGALNGNIDHAEDTEHKGDNCSKLDNYFDDPSRILNFYDSQYYEGYKRTKSNK